MVGGQAVGHVAFDIFVNYLTKVGEQEVLGVHHLTKLDQISVVAGFGGCQCRRVVARRTTSGGNNMFRILAFDGGFVLGLLVRELSPACLNRVISASRTRVYQRSMD
jgi:hypothetical protein